MMRRVGNSGLSGWRDRKECLTDQMVRRRSCDFAGRPIGKLVAVGIVRYEVR